MAEGSETGDGHGRGRRRRRSRSGGGRSGSRGRGNRNKRQGRSDGNSAPKGNRARPRRKKSGGNGIRAAANNTPCLGAERYFRGELEPFELFCAYHLGLQSDGSFNPKARRDVARRFKTDKEGIDSALVEFKMDKAHVRGSSFDLEMAKLDVEVAPPGIDRVELARTIYGDFLAAGCGVGNLPERVDDSSDRSGTADAE